MADRPTFFIDRCLPNSVPDALRAAGVGVEVLDAHFPQNTDDVDWIPAVTARGWVILTKDKNIRRTVDERAAVLAAGARIFTLTSGNLRRAETAALFTAHLARIEQFVADHPPPFVAILTRTGNIEVVFPRPVSASDVTPAAPSE